MNIIDYSSHAEYGDSGQAWAPQTYTSKEFLVVEYDEAVVPELFEVYETLGCGGLDEILAQTQTGLHLLDL